MPVSYFFVLPIHYLLLTTYYLLLTTNSPPAPKTPPTFLNGTETKMIPPKRIQRELVLIGSWNHVRERNSFSSKGYIPNCPGP